MFIGHLTLESLPDKVWVGAVWDCQVKGRVQDPLVLDSWAVHLCSSMQMNQDRCQGLGMGMGSPSSPLLPLVRLPGIFSMSTLLLHALERASPLLIARAFSERVFKGRKGLNLT